MTAARANLTPAIAPGDWIGRAPSWVDTLLQNATSEPLAMDAKLAVSVRWNDQFSLVSVRARSVSQLPPADVEAITTDAYRTLAERLRQLPAHHAVRLWNYIPDIHRPSGTTAHGDALDRYMIFNAGRHAACSQWLGGESAFNRLLATASGVGHDGSDLVIHALSASSPGVAVENPRQVPAYRYSRRYGPKPPCFARATVIPAEKLVLVGGTASVRGETSVHIGNLSAQFTETSENLQALLRAAGAADASLDDFTDVRVYHVQPSDLPALQALSAGAFPTARLELIQADLCRRDLLVEIEGVAKQ